ncbi:MAG: GNAT family N-acetyltransferase [Thermoanaerobaculales bacterium]|nr:GNAT family N-acetyltransferase [Thermoanaerobaculales bacterium]
MKAETAVDETILRDIRKKVTLRDGRTITVRRMQPDDVQRSYEFFCALPADDRKYLRVDVTRRDLVERRTLETDERRTVRVVAEHDGEIVADGTLELEGHGWGNNVAEVRLIVASSWQRLGLGTVMARELFNLASQHRVDRIVARLMRPQAGAHRIFKRLGFHEEFLIPEHVRDQSGAWQDLIIMRCPLEDLWQDLEFELANGDFQRHR